MSTPSDTIIVSAITAIGAILLVIVKWLTVIHTVVNSRLTDSLNLNHQLEEEKRMLVEEKYQLREQLALAKQLQHATEQLPEKK